MLKKFTFIALIAMSCSKDDNAPLVISDVEINVKYDKQHQYSIKRGNKTLGNSEVTWSLNDKNLGTISTDGLFKARKVGTSHVTVSYNGALVQGNINVTPYSTLFTEPIAKFGSSLSDIKYLEKRTVIYEESGGVVYADENNKIEGILYLFDSNNKLEMVAVIFVITPTMVDDVSLFFKERYPKYGVQGDYVIFVDDDKTKAIGLTVSGELGLAAIYLPSEGEFRKNNTQNLTEKQRKAINKLKAELARNK